MPVNLLPRPPFSEAGFTIGPAAEFSAFYSPLVRLLITFTIFLSSAFCLKFTTSPCLSSLCLASYFAATSGFFSLLS